MPVLKEKLKRNEKRLISRIKSPKAYKVIAGFIFMLFWFKKNILVFLEIKKVMEWFQLQVIK